MQDVKRGSVANESDRLVRQVVEGDSTLALKVPAAWSIDRLAACALWRGCLILLQLPTL